MYIKSSNVLVHVDVNSNAVKLQLDGLSVGNKVVGKKKKLHLFKKEKKKRLALLALIWYLKYFEKKSSILNN